MQTFIPQRKLALAPVFAASLVAAICVLPSYATCGGGGGGGTGGISSGPLGNQQVYNVPWRIVQPSDPAVTSGLLLYWLPASTAELSQSSLRYSRSLSLYASQCVTMGVVDPRTALGQKLIAGETLPVAILAQPDGTIVAKDENTNGKLNVSDVEKMVQNEIKKRDASLKEQLKDAKGKSKSGDKQAAIAEYRAVLEQKCLFPDRAKDAAKELKKLGVNDVGEIPDHATPVFEARSGAEISRVMQLGLQAENDANYPLAAQLYQRAHRMDPADPAPLRYLGEVYRHEIGDWAKARAIFNQILAMPADPLSRAVALHGLGKMTIHEGEFKKGLALMERSVATYPLALAHRNLAVYWNSEGDSAKTNFYVQKALELEPHDPFNVIFGAVFSAANGQGAQALKLARANDALLPASYNLAAIYAETGHPQSALAAPPFL